MSASESASMSGIAPQITEIATALRNELFVFFLAVSAYFVVFGIVIPYAKRRAPQPKGEELDSEKVAAQAGKKMQVAALKKDYRSVLKGWNVVKKSNFVPANGVNLGEVVLALQSFKPDKDFVVREVTAFFRKHSSEFGIDEMNELLETLGRRMDSGLLEELCNQMPDLEIEPNVRTYEIRMQLQFNLRDFHEVRALDVQLEAEGLERSSRVWITLLKCALKENDFSEALAAFGHCSSLWKTSSDSVAPDNLLTQLALLAAKVHRSVEFLDAMKGLELPLETLAVLLPSLYEQKRFQEIVAVTEKAKLDAAGATSVLKAHLALKQESKARDLIKSLAEDATVCSPEFIQTSFQVLHKCNDTDLALAIYKQVNPTEMRLRAEFVKGFKLLGLHESACGVFSAERDDAQRLFLDAKTEKALLTSALKSGDTSLARKLMDATVQKGASTESSRYVSMLRGCVQEGNAESARKLLQSLEERGESSVVLHNAMLDALLSAGEYNAADEWMKKVVEEGSVDVVSYNTLIKGYVSAGTAEGMRRALQVMQDLQKSPVDPNIVTYNELLNAAVCYRGQRVEGMYSLKQVLRMMERSEVKPNHVTASIILKSLTHRSSRSDVDAAMAIVNQLQEDVDEVLVSSIIEACVRIDNKPMLRKFLKSTLPHDFGTICGSHTFGSLIKAYGFIGDVGTVWKCWKEMRARHIMPTAITLGCIVEAIVVNGDPEGAFELIGSLEEDEHCRQHVNSVIYCSVLKGFAREKRLARVFAVYEQMKDRGIEFSVAAFNATIDALARSNRMEKLSGILRDMEVRGIEPNLVTYSTMLKGYAQAGDMPNATKMLNKVQEHPNMQPDEIMFNSLIDGYAQSNDLVGGKKALAVMREARIKPSNFTLSVLIKLCSRCKNLDLAFKYIEDLSTEFELDLNGHVYANLIQACVWNRQLHMALGVLQQMLDRGISPLNRTYAALIRHCLSIGRLPLVVALVELALGARYDLPTGLRVDSTVAQCALEPSVLQDAVQQLSQRSQDDMAGELYCTITRVRPDVRLDSRTASSLVKSVTSTSRMERRDWGKGKGKGK